jgi:aminoglycoside phosphotransferase
MPAVPSGIDFPGELTFIARMKSTLDGLSAQQLRRAADIKEQIATLQRQLNRILGAPAARAPRKRRKLSRAARAKIAAAARARWARVKAGRK